MISDREQEGNKLKRSRKRESVYLTQTEVCSIIFHTSTQKALEKQTNEKHTNFWILQIWVQILGLTYRKFVTLGMNAT